MSHENVAFATFLSLAACHWSLLEGMTRTKPLVFVKIITVERFL